MAGARAGAVFSWVRLASRVNASSALDFKLPFELERLPQGTLWYTFEGPLPPPQGTLLRSGPSRAGSRGVLIFLWGIPKDLGFGRAPTRLAFNLLPHPAATST